MQPWLLLVGSLAVQKQVVSHTWLPGGLLFGGLVGLGAYQLSQDSRNIWIFLVTTGTMAGIMGMRFYQSGNFMPAGLTAGASLLMILNLGISVLGNRHP
uniref:Transmembrane protein 14C n=2 Tax=Sus scrofa TaxID=9823 RepID=A0A287ATT1_PIG